MVLGIYRGGATCGGLSEGEGLLFGGLSERGRVWGERESWGFQQNNYACNPEAELSFNLERFYILL